MNTSSPRRKCLTQPKKCNSRNNTLLHMEKTASPNILISSVLRLQPAATRKGDIRSFSDMPILCQDHFGRVKIWLNSAQAKRSVIMALHAWLAPLLCMMQFDFYLPDYRLEENRGMTFISTLPPPAAWGVSAHGLSYHWQSSHFPSHNNGSFCPEAAAYVQFICSCITALRPWRTSTTPTLTNQPHTHSRFNARSTFSRSA